MAQQQTALGKELERRKAATDWGRIALCLAMHPNDTFAQAHFAQRKAWPRVLEYLEGRAASPESFGERLRKTAVVSGTIADNTWAGSLAPLIPMANEFVSFLRPRTIIGRIAGTHAVPFNCSFPRVTSGAPSASFVAEGSPSKFSRMSLDTVTLGVAKVVGIIPLTAELARAASPAVAQSVAADIAAEVAYATDRAFMDPNSAGGSGTPESITHAGTAFDSSGTTATNLVADAKRCLAYLDAQDIPLSECTWVATQALGVHLATLLTGTTTEPVFPGISLTGGSWVGGLPILFSNSARGGHSPTESILSLVHGPSLAVADAGAELDGSGAAAVEADDAPSGGAQHLTSLFQANLVAIRCTRFVNFRLRRTGAVATVRGINV